MIARLTGGGADSVITQASGENGGSKPLFLGAAAVVGYFAAKKLGFL